MATPAHLLIFVEMATPMIPISGNPKSPFNKMALPIILIKFMIQEAINTSLTKEKLRRMAAKIR